MFRLILLTIVGLFGVLAFYGTPEMAGGSTPDAGVAVAKADPVIAPQVQPVAGGTSSAQLIAAAMAGPAPSDVTLAGPRLQPSPEYAGQRVTAVQTAPAGTGPLYVTGTSVSMRAEPSPSGRKLASLSRGAAVDSVGATGGAWIEVASADGAQGFVSARYLSQRAPD